MTYQPKTGVKCTCKRGIMRDNCPTCEGTGYVIDFRAIRNRAMLTDQSDVITADPLTKRIGEYD